MKPIVILSLLLLVAGCGRYQPDQRVIGRYQATGGEVLHIRSDGYIVFVREGKEEGVGLATVDEEEPLSVRVIAPDTSRLVGTKIVFNRDQSDIVVEWPKGGRAAQIVRPTAFHRE